MFGEDVPGGPLDNGATLQLVDEKGFPTGSVVVPIEVKNRRDWIYPEAPELHQLLSKAAALQRTYPHLRFAPVLVCRRAQYTTFVMAKALGFYVVALCRQFLLPTPDVPQEKVDEVCQELGYDLEMRDVEFPRLVRQLTDTFPRFAARTAERWARNGPALEELFTEIRKEGRQQRRSELMGVLRDEASELAGADQEQGGW